MKQVTRKELNNLLEQSIDKKLKVINEQLNKYENGVLSNLIQFINYIKKNKDFNKTLSIYKNSIQKLEKTSKSYKSKNDPLSKFDKVTEKDIPKLKNNYEKLFKSEPPELQVAVSLLNYRYKLINSLVELIAKDKKNICQKFKDEDKCNKWFYNNLEDIEDNLEYVKHELKMVQKSNKDKQKEKILIKLSDSLL